MRILIDECIDERLRHSFPDHDCQTARHAGLTGLKNGELIAAAEQGGFAALLTVDQGFAYEQNLSGAPDRNRHSRFKVESLAGSSFPGARLSRLSQVDPTRSNRYHCAAGH